MGSLRLVIGDGWTSNDFVTLFTALSDINALLESLHRPSLLDVGSADDSARFRRRPIPEDRQVWVRSIDFHSPGDIRVDIGLGATAQVLREWAKDAAWREDFEKRLAAEELKRSETNTATERLNLVTMIITTADELGVRPEDLAEYVMPRMVKAVRALDRLRAEGRLVDIVDSQEEESAA